MVDCCNEYGQCFEIDAGLSVYTAGCVSYTHEYTAFDLASYLSNASLSYLIHTTAGTNKYAPSVPCESGKPQKEGG